MTGPGDNAVARRGATACRWLTSAVLAAAPLAWATRPLWAVAAVEWGVAAAVVAWALWVVVRRRRPAVPPVLVGCLGLLSLIGLIAAGNARSRYDPVGRRLVPVAAVDGLPSTIDRGTSAEAMARFAAVAAVLLVCCDGTAADRRWPAWVLGGVAAGGAGVATWGLLQAAGAVPPLRLEPWALEGATPFGPFSYHANAGAALNLAVAAALGLAAATRGRAGRAAAVAAAAACVAGAFVNVSRAAQVLTGVTLLAAAAAWVATRRRARRRRTGSGRRVTVAVAALAVVIAVAAVVAVAGGPARHRWASVGQQLRADSARPILWRIGLGLARTGGAWGLGPGTFKVVLPMAPGLGPLYPKYVVTWYVPGRPVSMWSNAHQDLLQAAIEWGWVGAGLWLVVFVGGVRRAIRPNRGWAVGAAALGLAVVGVHAMLDFPLQVFCIELQAAALLGVAWGSASTSPDRAPGGPT